MAKVIVKVTDKGWESHQDDGLVHLDAPGAGHWRRRQSCGRN